MSPNKHTEEAMVKEGTRIIGRMDAARRERHKMDARRTREGSENDARITREGHERDARACERHTRRTQERRKRK